jgi:hypothetical protein
MIRTTFTPTDVYDVPIIENLQGNTQEDQRPEANDVDSYDKLIGATILLDPIKCPGHVATKAKVVSRKVDHLGNPIGNAHVNPRLDTREYVVELEDGMYDSYVANTIAENLWSQCDAEGCEFNVIQGIIGHRKNEQAIAMSDGHYGNPDCPCPKRTTVGWTIEVEFANGTTDWLPLKDVKESNPIKLAKYDIQSRINKEPAFIWWVPHVL